MTTSRTGPCLEPVSQWMLSTLGVPGSMSQLTLTVEAAAARAEAVDCYRNWHPIRMAGSRGP